MDTMRDTLSDMYYPADMSEFDFDLLQDLHSDFNLLDDDGISTPLTLTDIKQECYSSNSNSGSDNSELSEIRSFDQYSSVDSSSSPFSVVDSPPLTPPSIDFHLEIIQESQDASSNNNNIPQQQIQIIQTQPQQPQPGHKRAHQQHIKIENESSNSIVVPEEIISKFPKILPAVISPTGRGRSASHDSPDIQALKRHIRMIRNRESASLSRKKKKDYMSNLESRVKELEIENAKLKHENCSLKSRLNQILQSDTISTAKSIASSILTSASSSSFGKKANNLPSATAKVALFGLCCFMFISIKQPNYYITPPNNSNSTTTNHHVHNGAAIPHSRPIALTHHKVPDLPPLFESPPSGIKRRSLLWNAEVDSHVNSIDWNRRNNDTNENITDDLLFGGNKEKSFINLTLTDDPIVNCPTAFNTTEAMRVQNDLKGIFSHKPKRRVPPTPKPFVYSLVDFNSNDNKELTVYDEKMRRFSRVLDQLHRRSDTFYVVSLAVESQLLLSAKSHNASTRPKMSLIMPWKNDTLGGKEEVLQIDCEVASIGRITNDSAAGES